MTMIKFGSRTTCQTESSEEGQWQAPLHTWRHINANLYLQIYVLKSNKYEAKYAATTFSIIISSLL